MDKIYFCRSLTKEIREKTKNSKEVSKSGNIIVENTTDAQEAATHTEESADEIYRTVLHASKLLEGRVTVLQLLKEHSIPSIERMVRNEMALIYESQEQFRNEHKVNAYTKAESLSAANLFSAMNNY